MTGAAANAAANDRQRVKTERLGGIQEILDRTERDNAAIVRAVAGRV
jgi:hypothetical protein